MCDSAAISCADVEKKRRAVHAAEQDFVLAYVQLLVLPAVCKAIFGGGAIFRCQYWDEDVTEDFSAINQSQQLPEPKD